MANEHVGARQEIAFTVETTRGTAVAPSSGDWFPHTGQGFVPVVEYIADDSGMGRIEGTNFEDVAKEYSQGTVSMRLSDSFLEPLNRMIFGAAGTVVTSVTTYEIENDNLHNSYTITTNDPVTGVKQHARAMLNTATITASSDDYVTLSMELMAGKEATTTATPGYSTTADLYVPSNISFGYADDFAGLATATTMNVKNFNINIEKNVEVDFASGSTEPEEITNGRFDVNGDFTITYDSTTFRAFAIAATQKAIVITLNNGAFKWELKFPSVILKDWNRDTDLGGIVTQTFGFTGSYKDQTNGLVQGVVTAL